MFSLMITASQSRMARAGLGWSIRKTAQKAHIGGNTLCRFESGRGVFLSTANSLRLAYEEAGVAFITEAAPSLAGGAAIRLTVGT